MENSLDRLRDFPEDARREAGYELYQVQKGRDPNDRKAMATIDAGVRKIEIRDALGAYRVIYIATFADAIHVLHAFQKKTQKTARRDLRAGGGTAAAVEARNRIDEDSDLRQCVGCPGGQSSRRGDDDDAIECHDCDQGPGATAGTRRRRALHAGSASPSLASTTCCMGRSTSFPSTR